MKYILAIAALHFFALTDAQDSSKLYETIFTQIKNDYHKVVIISSFERWDINGLPTSPIIKRLNLDSVSVLGIASLVKSPIYDSTNSYMNDLPRVLSKDAVSIWSDNRLIRENMDSATRQRIEKRGNELLKKRRYHSYNAFMSSPMVVAYNRKLLDSITFVVKITEPIFYRNLVVVEIANTAFGPWTTNSRTRLVFFCWQAGKWRCEGYY
jgi:hypothetical protein